MNISLVLQHKFMLGLQRLWGGSQQPVAVNGLRMPPMAVMRSQTGNATETVRCARPLHGMEVDKRCTRPVAAMPLRVVRVVEQGQPRSSAGRLVISGRMADVCAELDRLVAHEAALH